MRGFKAKPHHPKATRTINAHRSKSMVTATPPEKPVTPNAKAPDSGAFAYASGSFYKKSKPGTPPAIPITSNNALGDLDTGRSRLPTFTPAALMPFASTRTPLLGNPVQAGWNSLFYYSRRFTCNRQRPSCGAPAQSPCKGRAATRVSNNPPSVRRSRQFTFLPLSISWPF